MSTSVVVAGVTYTIPSEGELDWAGTYGVDAFLVALAANVFKTDGGTFTLLSEVDFGATAGLKAISYKSRASDVAQSGVVRLGNTEKVVFRNAADSADLPLSVNASDQLTFNDNPILPTTALTADRVVITGTGGVFTTGGFKISSDQMLFPLGSVSLPSISMDGDPDTGIYSATANRLSVATAGVERARFDSSGISVVNSGQVLLGDGLVGAGGLAFINDPDTGIYRPTTNRFSIAAGGTEIAYFQSTGQSLRTGVHLAPSGSVSAPTYSFNSDTDTGMFLLSDGQVSIATAGVSSLTVNNGTVSAVNGDFRVTRSASAASVTSKVENSAGVAGSNAVFNANCGSTSSGDPFLYLTNTTGGTDWYVGKDNSDSSTFKIGTGGTVGTNTSFSIVSTGRVKLHSGILGCVERSTPATPATNEWDLYFKTDGLYYLDDTGTEYKVTAV